MYDKFSLEFSKHLLCDLRISFAIFAVNKVFIILIIFSNLLLAQDSSLIKFSFNSKNNIYNPPSACLTESRIGLMKDFNSSKIRLDIGSSPDILDFYFNKNNLFEKISIGADFHSFGLLLNKSEKIILQVDAIDAFFGGHISLKNLFNIKSFSSRFRIMHLSSHLVDGHYDTDSGKWKDNKTPQPFGREFIEFNSAYNINNLTFFAGLNYIFRQRPDVLSDFNYDFAFDYKYSVIDKILDLYISYNIKITGLGTVYSGDNSLEAGAFFGNERGIKLYFLYYSGKNYYGEYYNEKLEFTGAGFNIIP